MLTVRIPCEKTFQRDERLIEIIKSQDSTPEPPLVLRFKETITSLLNSKDTGLLVSSGYFQ